MKTFQQIGEDHGELVQRKNAAYGSSFAKCGEYMRLLYPDGVRPDQYEDVLLLARDFDKNMRIANHRDAFGENPYSDKIGYAILGYHLHQRTNEESTTCPGNANGAAKRSGNDPRDSAPSHARSTTGPSTSATPEPAHLPQPDGCSIPLESSTAPAAPGPASANAEDQLEISSVAMDILQKLDAAYPRNLWWHEVVDGRRAQKVVVRLEHLNLIASKGHSLRITELGRASLCASRIAEGRRA